VLANPPLQSANQLHCLCPLLPTAMAEWAPPPPLDSSSGKRRPGDTTLLQVASKRQHRGDVNPGREYVEPRVYQQPSYGYEQQQQEQVRCRHTLPHPTAGSRRAEAGWRSRRGAWLPAATAQRQQAGCGMRRGSVALANTPFVPLCACRARPSARGLRQS
jgi:hypothetical protein